MSLLSNPQSRGYARLTGTFYLSIALIGPFSILWVPSQIMVAGDPATTIANLTAARGLYLAGLAGEVGIILAEIMATTMLYFMFRTVNETLSLAAALARYSMALVMAAMLFFSAGALALADQPLAGLDATQRTDLAYLMLRLHDAGVWIWQIFFTVHLALLGHLVARSGTYPRVLGYALSVGSIGYLLDTIHRFALPDQAALGTITAGFLILVSLAEVSFTLWLLFVGPRARTVA